jgi:hypothetical protein
MLPVEVKRMQAIFAVVWLIAIAVILIAGLEVFSLSPVMSFDVSGTLENIVSCMSGFWSNELYVFHKGFMMCYGLNV